MADPDNCSAWPSACVTVPFGLFITGLVVVVISEGGHPGWVFFITALVVIIAAAPATGFLKTAAIFFKGWIKFRAHRISPMLEGLMLETPSSLTI